MNILLHICCGPCLIYPWSQIKAQGHLIEGFFYNPNIDSQSEYDRRKAALIALNQDYKISIKFSEYCPDEFYNNIINQAEAPERCLACWRLRLEKTAQAAGARGFKFFSTTLLVSPFQNHELLRKIGSEVAEQEKINFYYADFRKGYVQATAEAKRRGLYRQKYCGCRYSNLKLGNKEK